MSLVECKCPNCGAPIKYEIDKQVYICEYCHSVFKENKIADKINLKKEEKKVI